MSTFNWPAITVTASSGPVQFNKNAVATTVSQDTGTPANSTPLPVLNLNGSGVEAGTVGAPFSVSAASLPLPSGAATAAKQPALGTAGTASADVLTVQGIASMTALKVDGSATTQPVNQTQMNGVAVSSGNGVAGTGVQRVTVASDNTPFAVKIDQTTPGTTNLVALAANQSVNQTQINGVAVSTGNGVVGTGVQRVSIASDNTAFAVNATLQTGANVIGSLTANQSINNAQINGVTPLMGNGVTGTGSQRVTIASDNTAFSVNAVQSGTWTVQPGNTANTTAWLTSQVTSSSSAVTSVASSSTTVSLLASNASRKNATFYNDSTSILYLKLGTTASTSSFTLQIAAGGYYELPVGKIYTGAIDGLWSSANGNVRITELS